MKKIVAMVVLGGLLSIGLSDMAIAQGEGVDQGGNDDQSKINQLNVDLGRLQGRISDIESKSLDNALSTLETKINNLPRGEIGDRGPDGIQGKKGELGAPGFPGERGDRGRDGVDGKDGAQGPPGPRGKTGRAGPMGPMGLTGPQGKRGEQGKRGPRGPAGPDGRDGTGAKEEDLDALSKVVAAVEKDYEALKVKEEEAFAGVMGKIDESLETLEKKEKKQRVIAAIHNALSGVQYVFGEDNRFSMSGSVGFHNSSNVAVAVGLAMKVRNHLMAHISVASSESMEDFGGNVGISIKFW